MIDRGHPRLSIVRQCELASISRSSFYREPAVESEETLRLMRLIDEQFLETPWYGSRQMARHLRRNGWCVGRHRVRRLMLKMGLAPIYQRPKTSEPHPQHRTWPYLLRHLTIDRPNQVWCADVTYIPMRRGFLYLVAIQEPILTPMARGAVTTTTAAVGGVVGGGIGGPPGATIGGLGGKYVGDEINRRAAGEGNPIGRPAQYDPQQSAPVLGNWCGTPVGIFGPGPWSPVGTPCHGNGPYGPVFGQVTQ